MAAPSIEIPEEWEYIFSPISEAKPTGEFLLYEATYDQIRAARTQENPHLPQGVWESKLKVADWSKVKDLCTEALSEKTKDLQICAWLLEALTHLEGFHGTLKGLHLFFNLSKTYWEKIYPPIEEEEEDCEFRNSPLTWLNQHYINPLKSVAITAPTDPDYLPFNFLEWEKIQHHDRLPKSTEKPADETEKKEPTKTDFLLSEEETPDSFYRDQEKLTSQCLELIIEIDQYYTEKCPKEAASVEALKKTLKDILAYLQRVLQNRDSQEEETEDATSETGESLEEIVEMEETGTEGTVVANSQTTTPTKVKIQKVFKVDNREEAYRALTLASDYLLKTEPHSPVPYLVKRAITWGNMDLNQVLLELMKNNQNLAQIYELLGMQPPAVKK